MKYLYTGRFGYHRSAKLILFFILWYFISYDILIDFLFTICIVSSINRKNFFTLKTSHFYCFSALYCLLTCWYRFYFSRFVTQFKPVQNNNRVETIKIFNAFYFSSLTIAGIICICKDNRHMIPPAQKSDQKVNFCGLFVIFLSEFCLLIHSIYNEFHQ